MMRTLSSRPGTLWTSQRFTVTMRAPATARIPLPIPGDGAESWPGAPAAVAPGFVTPTLDVPRARPPPVPLPVPPARVPFTIVVMAGMSLNGGWYRASNWTPEIQQDVAVRGTRESSSTDRPPSASTGPILRASRRRGRRRGCVASPPVPPLLQLSCSGRVPRTARRRRRWRAAEHFPRPAGRRNRSRRPRNSTRVRYQRGPLNRSVVAITEQADLHDRLVGERRLRAAGIASAAMAAARGRSVACQRPPESSVQLMPGRSGITCVGVGAAGGRSN